MRHIMDNYHIFLLHCLRLFNGYISSRTGLQLHDLDQQDEFRLITCVYALMRGGLLEDAQVGIYLFGTPRVSVLSFVSIYALVRGGIIEDTLDTGVLFFGTCK